MNADTPMAGAQALPEFTASADHYDRFMGRYAFQLAPLLVDAAQIAGTTRVLDVGCGTGSLTKALAARVGADSVAAIDPAPQFTAACQMRTPGADVRIGVAEQLPWTDDEFDAALSCLVLGFMTDPDRGLAQMRRVTRSGGVVALCMWDLAAGGMAMLRLFWDAVRRVDPTATGEEALPGAREGDIANRLTRAGLLEVTGGALTVKVEYAGFDEFWVPFTFAVGPAGRYLGSLPADRQAEVRDVCQTLVPDGAFTLEARAWWARGLVP